MKKIYIEKDEKYVRIAIKEDDRLYSCYIDEERDTPIQGDIYLGCVKNIVPAIKAAFIDIGTKKDGYLYLDKKYKNNHLKKGEYILVEILKEETETKGPKITNLINIPGSNLVISPYETGIRFSSKIKDEEFKKKAKRFLSGKTKYGIVVRSSASSIDEEELLKELYELCDNAKDVLMKKEYYLIAQKLTSSGGVLSRVLRDYLTADTSEIIVDDKEIFEVIKEKIKTRDNTTIDLSLYDKSIKIFSYYNIEKELLSLINNKINLNCGGNLVIEKTEAMHVIDVNSSKNIKEREINATILKTNLQAAKESARQIILRNLSGIIIIDFINMKDEKHKKEVFNALRENFKEDGTRTVVFNFSPLDIIQISRKKIGSEIYDFIEEEYNPHSDRGIRLKFTYLKLLIKNDIIRLQKDSKIKEYVITVSSIYKGDITYDIKEFVDYVCTDVVSLYIIYEDNYKGYKVEPIIFDSQRRSLKEFKIF